MDVTLMYLRDVLRQIADHDRAPEMENPTKKFVQDICDVAHVALGLFPFTELDETPEDEWYKRMAIKKAKKQKVQILPATIFPLIGICGDCAEEVRAVPNWGCRNPVCPHRP